ncbi:hypothetical protein [Paraflavitalea speifideaquila]|uniref:hypothetical protein n=1 Tax=Paraflavitalea speifideaquila TaxID=3076558 RepID=UPI0028EC1E5E|nr:hypothetical protein [Paraflavitalea speifideiaquila]
MNTLAHSGLDDAFAFRESTTVFHRQLCHFCFEPLFAGRMMTRADFDHIPVFTSIPRPPAAAMLLRGLGWLWLLTAIAGALAYYRLRYRV